MLTSAFSGLSKHPFASYLRPAILGGVVSAALNAGGAFALDFNFNFSGGGAPTNPATVTGLISGLVDNTNNQTSGLTVTITSATNGPAGGFPLFTNYIFGEGIDVSNGIITDSFILFDTDQINLGLRTGPLNSSNLDAKNLTFLTRVYRIRLSLPPTLLPLRCQGPCPFWAQPLLSVPVANCGVASKQPCDRRAWSPG
jgi:hypothetical protein